MSRDPQWRDLYRAGRPIAIARGWDDYSEAEKDVVRAEYALVMECEQMAKEHQEDIDAMR